MYRIYKRNDFDFSIAPPGPLIVISDIDETYLRTDFRSLRGLAATALQFAIDKIVYPDMSLLFKTLKRRRDCALFFISSSPRQLRGVMERTFLLEEVPHDGMVLRDTLHLALSGKASELRNPFGYKLFAILELLSDFPDGSRLVLLGDDTESDADVYEIVRRLSAGDIGKAEIERVLYERGIHTDHVVAVLGKLARLTLRFDVAALFIRITGSGGKGREARAANPIGTGFTHPAEIMKALAARGIVDAADMDYFLSRSSAR
jgi:hypothetical protein